MKKSILVINLLSLFHISIHAGWEGHNKALSKKPKESNTPGFHLTDRRAFFVEADYLFWKPQIENNVFSIKTDTSEDLNALTISVQAQLKQPAYHLSSGVRVGIGGYTSDSWDIRLQGTYLYSDGEKKVTGDLINETVSAIPVWFGPILGFNSTKAKNHWDMNFGLIDLSFGREFFLTKCFALHPFMGLRSAIIRQMYMASYIPIYTINNGTQAVAKHTQFSATSNIWGVGPRAGIDLNFYVSRDWSFLGGVAAALLYTHYTVEEKFKGLLPIDPIFLAIHPTVKDSNSFGRCNIDAYFGLGWNHWYNQGKNRLAIALKFEAQQWFNLNQWFTLNLMGATGAPMSLAADKNMGDLSLIGGTVHFQYDF